MRKPLGRLGAVERGRDSDPGLRALVVREEGEEAAPEHLLLRPPDRALEALVDRVADDRPIGVDDDEQARSGVGERAQEVALTRPLGLLPLPLRDVEPTADDVADTPVVVVEGCRRPRNRQSLAQLVDERVLEARRLVGGRRLLEAAVPLGALLGADEDVREHLPLDVVLEDVAACVPGRVVQVRDPPFAVDRAEQRGGGVHDRLEERDLRAELRLEAFVVQPQTGGRRRRLGRAPARRRASDRGGALPSAVQRGRRALSPVPPAGRATASRRRRRSVPAPAASMRSRASGRRAAPASASRIGVPRSSASKRSPTPERASRLRSTPRRNASGTMAKAARKTYSSGLPAPSE